MPKQTPCLWFDGQGEEAAQFYCSVFPNSRITDVARYGKAGPGREGDVMVVAFELDGQPYVALNGGPQFPFTEAVSFQIRTDDQEETDRLWNAIVSNGGTESMCGWCKDRWGLSWQITPRRTLELNSDPDPGRAQRAMEAMLTMKKIDIAALEAAVA